MTDSGLRERAFRAYWNEARFHAIVQAVVADAIQRHGPCDPHKADRDAYNIATDACATLLQRMYEDDAELAEQKRMADTYRKMAEEALAFSPPRMVIPLKPVADSGL